jgi:acyl CoA:acetate/3-ketoacid CoA transferase beta subunit
VFDFLGGSMVLVELQPGVMLDEVRDQTEARYTESANLVA